MNAAFMPALLTAKPAYQHKSQGDTMTTQTPTVRIRPNTSWEITLPPSILAGTNLDQISITSDGLYIADVYGRYDLIPFDELASLLEDGPLATVSLTAALVATNGHAH